MIRRSLAGLARVEDAMLVGLLLLLIVLAGLQILMRNLIGGSLPWADPVLRAAVMWLALAGAAVATREQRQITVDALTRRFAGRSASAISVLTHSFTAIVCALLSWHGGRFVRDEMQFGSDWIGGMPGWLPVLPIPLFLGLIGIRYALFAITCTQELIRGDRR